MENLNEEEVQPSVPSKKPRIDSPVEKLFPTLSPIKPPHNLMNKSHSKKKKTEAQLKDEKRRMRRRKMNASKDPGMAAHAHKLKNVYIHFYSVCGLVL